MRKFGMLFQERRAVRLAAGRKRGPSARIQSDGVPPDKAREGSDQQARQCRAGTRDRRAVPLGAERRACQSAWRWRAPSPASPRSSSSTSRPPVSIPSWPTSSNDLIVKCVSDLGATAVSITHDMVSARKIGHRITPFFTTAAWSGRARSPTSDRSDSRLFDQFIHGRAEGPIQMQVRKFLTMPRAPSLDEARRHFAEASRGEPYRLRTRGRGLRRRAARALRGGWRLLHDGDGYWSTPDAQPHWLYLQRAGGARREAKAQYRRPVALGLPFRPDRRAARRARCCSSVPAPATTRRSWPNSPDRTAASTRSRSTRAWRRKRGAISSMAGGMGAVRRRQRADRRAVGCNRRFRRCRRAGCLVARCAGRRRAPRCR